MLFNLSFISTEELQELFLAESQRLIEMFGKPVPIGEIKKIINDLQSIHYELSKRTRKQKEVI